MKFVIIIWTLIHPVDHNRHVRFITGMGDTHQQCESIIKAIDLTKDSIAVCVRQDEIHGWDGSQD